MNRFKVAFNLSKDELTELCDRVGSLLEKANFTVVDDPNYDKLGTFTVVPNRLPLAERAEKPRALREPRVPGQRKLRGSKVNETVLEKLKEGQVHSNDLRRALEAAGLAPGSLSTALSVLQKSGQVKRLGEGMYGLAEAA